MSHQGRASFTVDAPLEMRAAAQAIGGIAKANNRGAIGQIQTHGEFAVISAAHCPKSSVKGNLHAHN